MKIGNWKLEIAVLLFLALVLPLSASAFSLVNCGQSDYSTDPPTIKNPCQLKDLVLLIVRMINYLLTVVGVVAIHRVLSVGWDMVAATGIPEKIKSAREGLEHAVIGFAAVVLSFVFLNLLMNGLLGIGSSTASRPWWDPKCIYLDSTECPQGVLTPRPNETPWKN